MNLKTEIAGIEFDGIIYNAAGPLCVTLEELEELGESGSAAIMTKSCTLKHRDGNEKPRYADIDHGSINSMGLPNMGYEKYAEWMPKLKEYGKPVCVSVSGMSLEANVEMIKTFSQTDVDLIELNLSCPNLKGKPQVGYDFEQVDMVLEKVMEVTEKPLGVKLPPYFDMVHFKQVAKLLNKHEVAFVTCVNSIGNALFIDPDEERAVIRPKGGFGGIGGKYVKPTALANVRKFCELLDDEIDVIGVGGIYSGKDAFEYFLAGAKAVQVGTVFKQEKHGVFDRIEKELEEFMASKSYDSIEDFRGKLKPL